MTTESVSKSPSKYQDLIDAYMAMHPDDRAAVRRVALEVVARSEDKPKTWPPRMTGNG